MNIPKNSHDRGSIWRVQQHGWGPCARDPATFSVSEKKKNIWRMCPVPLAQTRYVTDGVQGTIPMRFRCARPDHLAFHHAK